MLPKVRLEYSREYNRALNHGLSDAEFQERFGSLKARCARFEALFERNAAYVLEGLEKLSGYAWRTEALTVHVVDGPRNRSFAAPLTLQWHPDAGRMLLVLAHELGHALIPGVGPGREAALNAVAERLAGRLGLDGSAVEWLHAASAREHPGYARPALDLDAKPLRDWEAPLT